MFECPATMGRVRDEPSQRPNDLDLDLDLGRLLQRGMQPIEQQQQQQQHKGLVAKKYHQMRQQEMSENPFLFGERLPVAAKKGIDVVY